MVHGHDVLVLRPPPKNLSRGQRLFPWLFFAVLLSPAVIGLAVAGSLVGVLIVLALPTTLGLLIWGSGRRSRITVTPHEISVQGLILRKRGQRARGVRVVRAIMVPVRGMPYTSVFVLDAAGRAVIRIYGQNYRREDIDHLVDSIGLPWSGPDEAVTAKQLSTMYPGLVRWHEAYPFQFGAMLAACAAFIIIVAGVVVALLTV